MLTVAGVPTAVAVNKALPIGGRMPVELIAGITHGTPSSYRRGCRCDTCRDAKRIDGARYAAQNPPTEESRSRARERRKTNPGPARERDRRYREGHKAKPRPEYFAEYRRKNADKRAAQESARRARVVGADHGCVPVEVYAIPDGAACSYCSSRAAHVDHMHPIFGGGLHCVSNLTYACVKCNTSKRAIPLDDWLAKIGKPQSPAPLGVCPIK